MKQNIVILVFSVLLFSCTRQKPNNFIGLIDFSASRDSIDVIWYKQVIKEHLLKHMGAKDRLTLLPVDYSSITVSTEFFSIDFSKNNYTNEFAGFDADRMEQKSHRDSITTASSMFDIAFVQEWQHRKGFPEGTDIFGALENCRKYIISESRNITIIYSDMFEYTGKGKISFEDSLKSEADVEKFLKLSPKIDLSGVEIIVLTGNQQKVKPEIFMLVKKFWTQYFKQCNAQLLDYSSESVSSLGNIFTTTNNN